MHIIPYISQYLHQHKKVAVMGLGVFYLKRVNGFLDQQNHTVYPPSIKIKFEDKEVLDNDFAQNISDQTQLDLDKVIYLIEKLVRDIKEKIESGSAYLIENIGSLELNRGHIKLINSDSTHYNQDFFGFTAQTFKPISTVNINSPVIIEDKVLEIPVEIELELPHQQEFPITYSLAEQALKSAVISEDDTKRRSKFSWFWLLAIILLITTIAVISITFYTFPPFKNDVPVKKVVNQTKVYKPDSIFLYEVIIAEKLSDAKANKLIAKLVTKGIDAHLLSDSLNNNIQISAAQFTNLDSAEAKLKIIQQKFYPKAYLKTIKSIK